MVYNEVLTFQTARNIMESDPTLDADRAWVAFLVCNTAITIIWSLCGAIVFIGFLFACWKLVWLFLATVVGILARVLEQAAEKVVAG